MSPFVKDLRVPVVALLILHYHPSHEREDFLIPREYDMGPADIECEPLPGLRPAEPAVLRLRLKDDYLVSSLVQEPGKGQRRQVRHQELLSSLHIRAPFGFKLLKRA